MIYLACSGLCIELYLKKYIVVFRKMRFTNEKNCGNLFGCFFGSINE